ncbi:hypothetical protein [Ferrimonas aestuarii]|nr:hypothetical protein [Ferrimonas aestuarii]
MAVSYTLIQNVFSMPIAWDPETGFSNGMVVLQMLAAIAMAPIEAGLSYIGLKRAQSQPVTGNTVWAGLPHTAALVLISLLTGFINQLGFVLFFVLGLGLVALTSLANLFYLVNVDKRITPITAILESAKVMWKQLLPILGAYIVAVMLMVMSSMPMAIVMSGGEGAALTMMESIIAALVTLIGLAGAMTFFFQLKGVLYHQLFGETRQVEQPSNSNQSGDQNGSFEA